MARRSFVVIINLPNNPLVLHHQAAKIMLSPRIIGIGESIEDLNCLENSFGKVWSPRHNAIGDESFAAATRFAEYVIQVSDFLFSGFIGEIDFGLTKTSIIFFAFMAKVLSD